ncbi:MAG: DUF4276 family protein, partial [Tannerella sp.]|nr:DUF4276 family protein [Tannerella sp.]
KTYETHYYTTMFDLYALPDDFPGYVEADKIPATAPSKRIIREFGNIHHYDKPKSGEFVTDKVGIETLKSKCLHFKEWIEKLEKLSET